MRRRLSVAAARWLGRTLVVGVLTAASLAGAAFGSPGRLVAGSDGAEQLGLAQHGKAAVPSGRNERLPVVRATREIVMLLNAHRVFSALRSGASEMTSIGEFRPITGSPTVVPLVGRATGTDGALWLRVLIP